jgi:hypothetical protein
VMMASRPKVSFLSYDSISPGYYGWLLVSSSNTNLYHPVALCRSGFLVCFFRLRVYAALVVVYSLL